MRKDMKLCRDGHDPSLEYYALSQGSKRLSGVPMTLRQSGSLGYYPLRKSFVESEREVK